MLFLSFLSTLLVPFACKFLKVHRQVKLAVWFFVIMQLVGIYPRAIIIVSGMDSSMGPFKTEWIEPTFIALMLYNLFFLVGILFVHFITLSKKGINNVTNQKNNKIKFVGNKGMLFSLVICSLPGLFFLLTPHSTMLNDQNIALTRTQTQGLGPQIVLGEIPYMALVVWYSFKKGIVSWKWWICTLFLISLSVLSGSRSQALDFILVLVALRFIQSDLKIKKKTLLNISLLGLILLYMGWIVFYARSMLKAFGGSFFTWSLEAMKENPLNVYNLLLRHSLNGYDGLISVVGLTPTPFNHQPGALLYQMITILIPRTIWDGKWSTDLVSQFTQDVWGWDFGGNFVTGPGAMYIDSGWLGIIFGSLLLGIITCFLCRARVSSDSNHWFAKIIVALWCLFIARFTFAGGAMDANISGRMLMETLFMFLVIKFVTTYIVKTRKVDEKRRKLVA